MGSDCWIIFIFWGYFSISIHAPRVGSDVFTIKRGSGTYLFQSTLPVWGATERCRTAAGHPKFQSTLPVWGATAPIIRCGAFRYIFQSTLPVWGATLPAPRFSAAMYYFNPRSPCGERQAPTPVPAPKVVISIHAPRVGSDLRCSFSISPAVSISIHAPRVGSDVTAQY